MNEVDTLDNLYSLIDIIKDKQTLLCRVEIRKSFI